MARGEGKKFYPSPPEEIFLPPQEIVVVVSQDQEQKTKQQQQREGEKNFLPGAAAGREEAVGQLLALGIEVRLASRLVDAYGPARVADCVQAACESGARRPAGWVLRALAGGWQLPLPDRQGGAGRDKALAEAARAALEAALAEEEREVQARLSGLGESDLGALRQEAERRLLRMGYRPGPAWERIRDGMATDLAAAGWSAASRG